MKKILLSVLILSHTGAVVLISCKKEKSCEGCRENNKAPTAIAGPDQVITLPTDSISLDGSSFQTSLLPIYIKFQFKRISGGTRRTKVYSFHNSALINSL
jgi:hypothetical protein